MKRKVMELGHSCYVVSLPKKWVDAHNIVKGDELDLEQTDEGLLFSSDKKSSNLKELSSSADFSSKTSLRTYIINAYRSGYDVIKLFGSVLKQNVFDIVTDDLIGFEAFSEKDYIVIESVSEPSYDIFKKLIEKRLFIVKDILENLYLEDCTSQMKIVQRYDNFIKRSIIKLSLHQTSRVFLWQWTSDITHVAKDAYHAQKQAKFLGEKILESFFDAHKILLEMFTSLQNAYLKKDVTLVLDVQKSFNLLAKQKSIFMKDDALMGYYIFHMARLLQYATSPLVGYIQLE